MGKIRGWQKLDTTIPQWTTGTVLIFVFNKKVARQVGKSEPRVIAKASTKEEAIKKAVKYMRSHPNG